MKIIKSLLIVVEAFVGTTALWGGMVLIATNGMGMPQEWLGKNFSSFLLPGIILCGVGILNLAAAISHLVQYRFQNELSASSGFGIMIFEFAQLYLLERAFWLQIFYFLLGLIIIVFTMMYSRNIYNRKSI